MSNSEVSATVRLTAEQTQNAKTIWMTVLALCLAY